MLRVLLSADLHYSPRSRTMLERMAASAALERPDCIVLAGDVGYPLDAFRQCLELFQDLRCPRLALAGNHDVWASDHDSQALWDHVLEETAHAAGFGWLDRDVFRLGSLGICGTLGWYDYSSRDPSLVLNTRDYFVNKGMVNNDGNYVDWPATDRDFAAHVLRDFRERLAQLCQDPAITQVLVATHVPPFAENLPHRTAEFARSLGRAYLGNLTLGQAIARCSKVTHVVSGHIHAGGRWAVATPFGHIESRVIGSDDGQPAYIVLEFPWAVA